MKTKPLLFVRGLAGLNRLALLLAAAGVLLCAANIQAAVTRYAVASGNWNSTSTWSDTSGGASGQSVPVAGDTANITAALSVTVNDPEACATLNVSNSASALLNVQNGGTLTVSGTTTLNNLAAITVDSGGTLSLATSTLTSGTVNNYGTITCSTTLSGSPTFTMRANSTLNIGGTSTWTPTFDCTTYTPNTVNYTGGTQTLKSTITAYSNLGLSGSGAKTTTGVTTVNGYLTLGGTATATFASLVTIGGNVTVGDGANTAGLTMSSANVKTIGGNVSISGGSSSFTLSGATSSVYITGTTTVGSGCTFSKTGTAAANWAFGGNVSISGTLSEGAAYTLYFTNNVTINSGGTLTENTTSAVNFAGSFDSENIYTASTGTHTFSGTGKTLAGTISIPTMTISGTGSYTLVGGANLTVSTALTLSSSASLLVNGTLNNTPILTVPASATLGGSGTISGLVSVSAGGILEPGGLNGTYGTLTSSANNAASLTLNGNVLKYNLNTQTTPGTTYSRMLVNGAAGALVLNGANVIYPIAPGGTIHAGTYTLMTYASQTGSGTLTLPNGGQTMGNFSLATTAGGSGANSGSVTLTVSADTTYASLTWSGAGGATWDSGAYWINDGTGSAASYADPDTVTFDDNGNGASTITSSGTVSPGSVIFNNNATNYTVSAVIGGSGSLVQLGTGTTTLGGANTYTGPTFIGSGGTLLISGQAGQYAGGFAIANGGTLQIGGGSALPGQLNSGSYAGNITNNGSIIGGGYGVYPQTLSGTISGSGSVSCNGQAANGQTLTLTGPNTFTGDVTVGVTSANLYFNSIADSGTSALGFGNLKIGGGNQSGSVAYNSSGTTAATTSRTITLGCAANAVHEIDNNSANAGATLALNGPLVLTPASNGGVKNFTLGGSNSGTNTFASTITNPPAGILNLNKKGAGTWLLTANNAYSGATTVSAGTLLVNGDNSAATNTVTVSANATLGGTGTIGGAVTNAGGTLTAKAIGSVGTLTLTNGLTLTPGSGIVTLNVDLTNATTAGVTYDQIVINGGVLTVNAGNNFVQFTAPGGTITNGVYTLMTYPSRSGSPITFVDGSTNIGNNFILTNGPTSLVLYVATTAVPPGLLTWKGGVNGTWDTTTANWTGLTTGLAAYFGDSSPVTFDDTATSFTVTNIAGSSGYSPGSVTFNNSANSYNVSATINGAGGVTKNGTGTVTLSGTNTFTGPTTINAGVLNIQNGAALGTTDGVTTVATLASLQLQGGITVAENILVNGTGLAAGGAIRSLSGNNTLSGTVTNSSVSRINCDADTLTITNLTNPSGNNFALTLGGAGNINFGGPLNIGIGNLTKDGAGALTLGASNKVNQVFLNAGTLNLNHTAAISGSANPFNIADGTTLNNTSGGPITLSGRPLIIYGNFTFTGTYDLNLGTVAGTLTNGSHTITTTAGTLTLGGAISDNGYANSLTKTGNGTLVLGGTNTYGGNTVINAGTLALGANGYITNSASIVVASNAVFDVSARSTPFTLASALSSQTLSNSAPGAIINGTNNLGAGTVSLVYNGVNPAFTLTNGQTTLSALTTILINNTGTQLAAGHYLIISNITSGTAGLVAGAVTTTPLTVGGNGATTTGTLRIASSGLWLDITSNTSIATTNQVLLVSGTPVYGNSLTFTATVYTNGVTAANATSNFVFKVDGTPVQTNGITSGAANFTIATLTATTHNITAEYSGDANYLPSTNTLSQSVSQKGLTITANNTNKIYNGAAFSGGNGVTYAGFVNGETNTVLGGVLSYSGTSQGAISVGSYVITPSGLTNLVNTNYNIGFANGTLTITHFSTTTNVFSSVTGNTLTLTWPDSHLGWMAQSNAVDLANPGDWHDITSSTNATSLSIPMDAAQTNVFYRLRLP